MELTLLTPHKKIIERETVEELYAPGIKGTLDILPGHANLATLVETGVLRWRVGNTWNSASVSKGILEIFDQHISVMADVSELARDIDVSRAKTAEKAARQKVDEGGLDDATFRKHELKLQRAIARQQAAE
jgi:F-type H+-transporting ATPase subunit epsilon